MSKKVVRLTEQDLTKVITKLVEQQMRDEIVFPDIPLSTQIKTSKEDILCIFISDIHIDDPGFMEHSLEKLGEPGCSESKWNTGAS